MKGRIFFTLVLALSSGLVLPTRSLATTTVANPVGIQRQTELTAEGPDLVLSADSLPTQSYAGEPLITWLHVANSGPGIATGVVLTDLPDNAGVELALPSQGWCDTSSGITCTIGTLVEGSHADLKLRF